MQKELIHLFIEDSPIEIGVFDTNMNFISCSKLWCKKLGLASEEVIGKSYYQIFPETTEEIRKIHEYCLKGSFISFEGEKTILPSGKIQWLNFKINSWEKEKDKVGGLIIVCEDISNKRNEDEYRLKAQKVANIGGWEVNLITNEVYWTNITKELHEVSENYVPALEEAVSFYKEGYHREKIVALVSEAISDGTPWDTELLIVTAKGVEKWVRVIGKVEYVNNKAAKITGTFQDIDSKKKAEINYQEILRRHNVATKTASIGVWDYDLASLELSCDENTYLLYEADLSGFENTYDAWKRSILLEDRDRVIKEMDFAIQHRVEFNTEFRIRLKNGRIKYIKSIAQVHKYPDSNETKMIGANWDITEFKHTELKLIKRKESFTGVFNNSSVGGMI